MGSIEAPRRTDGEPAPRTRALALCALLLATFAAWSGALVRGGFSHDDLALLRDNPLVEGSLPWSAAWTRDYWEHRGAAGHWRPLAALSLRLDHALWGEAPLGYHATNLALHLAVVLLAARLARGLWRGGGPWLGLGLFAVHPALADSVAWISGRTSMLSAIGGLAGAAVLAGMEARDASRTRSFAVACAAAAAGLFLALAGKEDGIVFAALYVLLGARRSRALAGAAAAGCALALAAWLALRLSTYGAALPSAPHAPLAGMPLAERALLGGAAWLEGLRIAAAPFGYPPVLHAGDLEGARHASLRGLAGWQPILAALAGGGWMLARGRAEPARLAGGAALLAGLAVLPTTQLVPAGELFAPRFLYLPLLFAAPLVSGLARALAPRQAARRALALLVLAACVPLAWSRAGVYRDRESYWSARLAHAPDDAVAWNAIGNARAEAGDDAGAVLAWERSVRLRPTFSRPWASLGAALLARGELEAAERALERALAVGPRNAIAHANYAKLLLDRGEARRAAEIYARACELVPGDARLWRGLGRALSADGRRAEALAALERALALDPGDAVARALLDALK